MRTIQRFGPHLIALFSVASLTLAGVADALVTFEFSGTISSVDDPDGTYGDFFGVDDPFTGSFSYEETDASGSNTQLPGESWSVTINGATLAMITAPILYNTTVTNGTTDVFGAGSSYIEEAPPLDFLTYVSAAVVFYDYTGTVFSSTALPMALDLADFDLAELSMGDNGQGTDVSFVNGTITSLTQVPEPSTALLSTVSTALLLGAGLTRFATRRRQR